MTVPLPDMAAYPAGLTASLHAIRTFHAALSPSVLAAYATSPLARRDLRRLVAVLREALPIIEATSTELLALIETIDEALKASLPRNLQ